MTRDVASTLLLCLLSVAGCASPPPENEATVTTTAVPVEVEVVRLGTIESILDITGVVTPAPGTDWVITAPDAGRIAELPKAEGDAVRAGDLLVRFDIPSLTAGLAGHRAELTQARARVESTRAAVTRLTGLVDRGIAARREVEEAQRDLAEAEGALARSESDVVAASALAERAAVIARFNGVVAKRWHSPGDFVDASATDPILRVIDPQALQVVAAVPVADLGRVRPGERGLATGPGGDPEAVVVVARPGQLDPTGSVGEVRLAFATATRLTSGTTVQVSISADRRTNVMLVPATAIVREGTDTFVMVAGEDKKAHRQDVTLGLSAGAQVEIVTGLKAGDRAIIRGQLALPDGAAVTVTP